MWLYCQRLRSDLASLTCRESRGKLLPGLLKVSRERRELKERIRSPTDSSPHSTCTSCCCLCDVREIRGTDELVTLYDLQQYNCELNCNSVDVLYKVTVDNRFYSNIGVLFVENLRNFYTTNFDKTKATQHEILNHEQAL